MSVNNRFDRRYQRTHEIIIHHAIDLALEAGWEKVNVTRLAEKANINRNSFYLHFNSINGVFDEVEERFVDKYRRFVTSSPLLDVMIKEPEYYNSFSLFLRSEGEYVAVIKKMGRSDQLLSKLQKVWMAVYETELSASQKYNDAKDMILPYIAGCTLIFFSNWINDPAGFDVQKNTLFSGTFIEHILTLASSKS